MERGGRASVSSLRILKNKEFRLYLLFAILVLGMFLVSGCHPGGETFPEICQGETDFTLVSDGGDGTFLCVPSNFELNPVCLHMEDGNHGSGGSGALADDHVKTINQMYSNFGAYFYYDIHSEIEGALNIEDAYDMSAILADYFFGDDDITCGDDGCSSGNGFFGATAGGYHPQKGGSAGSSCVKRSIMSVSNLGDEDSTFGLEDNEIDGDNGGLVHLGVNNMYPFFYCSPEIDERDAFNIYEAENSALSMENKIVTQRNATSRKFDKAFICKNGQWHDLAEYINSRPDWDEDGDGAPGSPNVFSDWDCDDSDPTKSPDLSFIKGFEDNIPAEICGDGKVNVCSADETQLYRNFDVEDVVTADGVDNCDSNPVACEENCLFEGNECDYLLPETEDDLGQTIPPDITGYETAGFCCGAREVDDAGRILEDPSAGDLNKLCAYVTADENYIVGNGDQLACNEEGEGDCPESDDWQWVNPETQPWTIFSIKEMGKDSFDVVSNGENWQICNSSVVETNLEVPNLVIEGDASLDDLKRRTNRYVCSNLGDRYSWVECIPPTEEGDNPGIKLREVGDGLYKLPLSDNVVFLDALSTENDQYYSQDTHFEYGADFTNFTHVEFFVELQDSFEAPLFVNMRVVGYQESDQGDLIYFDGPILGYTQNAPLLAPDYKIRIEVPIGNWLNVEQIQFYTEGSDVNDVLISHVALVGGSSDAICSGYETKTEDHDSWLEDLDFSQNGIGVSGKLACNARYGTEIQNAWLGGVDEVDDDAAYCCGNAQGEYYAGPTTTDESAPPLGCFNSQVIGLDETAMIVEYTVEHSEIEFDVTYPPQEFEFDGEPYTITADNSPMPLSEPEQYVKSDLLDGVDSYTFPVLPSDNSEIELYYFLPGTQKNKRLSFEIVQESRIPELFDLQIIAETAAFTTETEEVRIDDPLLTTFTNTCLQDECYFALPGIPGQGADGGYRITNKHPELYDMYFVSGPNAEDQTLITQEEQRFDEPGNIRVTKISQQVLYTQTDDAYEFIACNPAEYIPLEVPLAANEGICMSAGSHFCAPQTEDFLINSWSDASLGRYGYELEGYQEGDTLQPKSCDDPDSQDVPCSVEDRNHTTGIVPGRNMITNALFTQREGNDVLAWTLFYTDGTLALLEEADDATFTIPANTILRSEKIAILPETNYAFMQESECNVKIDVGTSLGTLREDVGSTFITQVGDAYAQIVISQTSECLFSGPSLHVVDDLGSFEEEYAPADEAFRTGVSCCPQGMCWNGYLCAQDMSVHTFVSEKIGDVDYRCIAGDWTYMGPKKDWNDDETGFCSDDTQCFVTSSIYESAASIYTAQDFYNGQYPTCINDGEYIFDHVCNEGTWSSRTKYLAEQFTQFAENEDYALYCSSFNDVFIDYDEPGYSKLRILAGSVPSEAEVATDVLGQPIGENNPLCSSNIDDEEVGLRLVPPEQNTCVNNVCVLKYKDGSNFEAAFATSLNLALDDPNTFIESLGLTPAELTACATTGTFTQCTQEVWYSPDLGAIIHAKNGIALEPSLFTTVVDWFVGLFSGSSADEVANFLDNATNINKLYILNNNADNKYVRALEEPQDGEATILAEYEGFTTPVCEYIDTIDPLKREAEQYPAPLLPLVECESVSDVYQVMVQTHPDFWWPQLTGTLRSFANE